MLDTFLNSFSISVAESLDLVTTLWVILSALLTGTFISFVYMKTHKIEGYNAGFTVTLIMLPTVIAVIILLVGSNVARAFSLAGAFSLIRFRSAPGDPKDIAYVFFTLAVGLACGMGYIAYGVLFTLILCAVMWILSVTNFGVGKTSQMLLKITIPEDLDFQGLFDNIMSEFTDEFRLLRVRTADFGSLFELQYGVRLKLLIDQKEFIDRLRSKNGNLNITLTLKEIGGELMS